MLKEEAAQFATKYSLNETIKKYSDFVSFPILVNGEKVNQSRALWARNKDEVTAEEYQEFYRYLSHRYDEPLHHLPLSVEAPVQFKALLYIPSEADRNLFSAEGLDPKVQLYVKRIFIQNNCKELLPQWLRFVHGVVDSEDLPLNVSREVTQHSALMAKINQFLTKKLIGEFKTWAETDKEKYLKFWKAFGNFIKEGLHTDHANKEKLTELYRAASSVEPQGLVSLQDYVDRMQPDQTHIYYVSGKTQAAIEANPNLEWFKNKGIEVLYLYDEVDEFVLPGMGPFQEKTLTPIHEAEIDASQEEEQKKRDLPPAKKEGLLALFKKQLGDKVEDVLESKRLVESPCTLVSAKDGMKSQMERMMKMMDPKFKGGKRVLEVNTRNPLIKSLAKIHEEKPKDTLVKEIVEELYEGAALMDGTLEDATQLVTRSQKLMTKLADLYAKTLA